MSHSCTPCGARLHDSFRAPHASKLLQTFGIHYSICYYRHVPVPCSCLFPLRLRLVKGHFSGAFASSRSDLEFGMCYCYSVFGHIWAVFAPNFQICLVVITIVQRWSPWTWFMFSWTSDGLKQVYLLIQCLRRENSIMDQLLLLTSLAGKSLTWQTLSILRPYGFVW